LGTTAADGRARILVPVLRSPTAALSVDAGVARIALADGFAPTSIEAGAPTVMRALSAMGRLLGVARDAQGRPAGRVTILPHYVVAGDPPADGANRTLWDLASWSARHDVPALAVVS